MLLDGDQLGAKRPLACHRPRRRLPIRRVVVRAKLQSVEVATVKLAFKNSIRLCRLDQQVIGRR